MPSPCYTKSVSRSGAFYFKGALQLSFFWFLLLVKFAFLWVSLSWGVLSLYRRWENCLSILVFELFVVWFSPCFLYLLFVHCSCFLVCIGYSYSSLEFLFVYISSFLCKLYIILEYHIYYLFFQFILLLEPQIKDILCTIICDFLEFNIN